MPRKAPDGYYCSDKFTWLSVDLEKRTESSCCAAKSHAIDLQWAKSGPLNILNSKNLQQERHDMLAGNPVSSCESVCWTPERNHQTSRRMIFSTQDKKFDHAIIDSLETLHVILGSTCNMTCVYCCKQYSSSWFNDINRDGPYLDTDRYRVSKSERILANLSQKDKFTSLGSALLQQELSKVPISDKVLITGGEPFLYNNLNDVINGFSDTSKIIIFTGLGISTERFRKELAKISDTSKIEIAVSAENINKNYEFIRFGNTWQRFADNLKILRDSGIKYWFSSVLSNVTIFGFNEFFSEFSTESIKYEFCWDPDFLNVNVMDQLTKDTIIEQISSSNIPFKDSIISTMLKPVTPDNKVAFSLYISEFARRRGLSFDIFPASFVRWIEQL
jgi:organic radical activating enzyme